jgi:hypothetical protein
MARGASLRQYNSGDSYVPSLVLTQRFIHNGLVHTYLEYSVCPLVGIGTPPPPLPKASVSLPQNQRGWEHIKLIQKKKTPQVIRRVLPIR